MKYEYQTTGETLGRRYAWKYGESKKNLAYVLYDFHTGGMETAIYNIASNLQNDFKFHFIATHVKEIHNKFKKIGKTAFVNDHKKLVDYYKKNNIDIVQVNIEDWYAKAAKEAGVKRVVERTDGDRNCCKSSKKYVDRVIASTKGTVPLIAKQINKSKIDVVYNGIDLEKFDRTKKRDRIIFKSDDIIIGRVGRLVGGKNISMLIKVMIRVNSIYPQAKLVIVGGDSKMPGAPPMKKILKQQAKPLGKNVIFTGDVENPTELINGFDIATCVSNPGNEGIPNSLIEPMGAGCAAIGTNVGNINEIIVNEHNGYLIPHNNESELFKALMVLVKKKKLRENMGANARKSIRKKFNIKNMVKKYREIYLG